MKFLILCSKKDISITKIIFIKRMVDWNNEKAKLKKRRSIMIQHSKGKKLLIFHPTVAPYRISFFNKLCQHFETEICLYYQNLKNQKFDYQRIMKKFQFIPDYFDRSMKLWGRTIYLGHRKRILDYEPNIVIVGEYGEGLWSAVLTRFFYRKQYRIITICDDSLKIAKECRGLRKISRNLGMRYIDGIVLCNDSVEAWYKEKFKVRTFNFPIIQDESEFRKNESEIVDLARRYIDNYHLIGKKVFLFVGRLAPEKNIEYLIRSFIENHMLYPDSILILVGGGSEKYPELVEHIGKMIHDAQSESYIIYVGRKEGIELRAWYSVGQVLILPSIYERFGAVVNEALLAGEYVMVSQNAGAACLVNNNNGKVIDIAQPVIDFHEIMLKVKAIDKDWKMPESRMPFSFDDKMDMLIEWIEKL